MRRDLNKVKKPKKREISYKFRLMMKGISRLIWMMLMKKTRKTKMNVWGKGKVVKCSRMVIGISRRWRPCREKRNKWYFRIGE